MRNYPVQPPVIPHAIDGYQLTLMTNRCLDCHRRQFTEGSGAPMISVTHFIDRDISVLADVTPRRYFCTACHVQQTDAKPLVPNTFEDMLLVGSRDSERVHARALRGFKNLLIWFSNLVSRPSAYLSFGFLRSAVSFAALFSGAPSTRRSKLTNTEKFCVSCHEMHDNVCQESQRTVHFSNRSRVRASCPD